MHNHIVNNKELIGSTFQNYTEYVEITKKDPKKHRKEKQAQRRSLQPWHIGEVFAIGD